MVTWGIAAAIVAVWLAAGRSVVWFLDRQAVRQGVRADWGRKRRSTWGMAAAWPLLVGALLFGVVREYLS
jgi:hypothetical protein